MVIKVEDRYRRSASFCSPSVGSSTPIRPALTSRRARLSKGRWVFALACVNEDHSALFQNHSGTFSASSSASGLTLKILTFKVESGPAKAREYSPFGSRTMKRAFGVPLPLRCDWAASNDHLMRPATEQDLPLPVLPRSEEHTSELQS